MFFAMLFREREHDHKVIYFSWNGEAGHNQHRKKYSLKLTTDDKSFFFVTAYFTPVSLRYAE